MTDEQDHKHEGAKMETKPEEKHDGKKAETKKFEKPKKTTACVNGFGLRISTKYAVAICDMIRRKKVDEAIRMVEEVSRMKRVVKMNYAEVGHKHGPGIMGGKYPIKAAGEFMRLLKQLNANALANEIDADNCVLFCKANVANRPYRRAGRRFKSTNLTLILEPVKNKKILKGEKK